MTALLYASMILLLALLGSKIVFPYLSDFLSFITFLFLLFPGISSLYIWTDYRKKLAACRNCRSTEIEIVGIASCLPTLLICLSVGLFLRLT